MMIRAKSASSARTRPWRARWHSVRVVRAVTATPERVRSADGTLLAVWRSGDGPPVLLVHGTAADHTRWAPVLPALSEHFTVLAMDRRGRGQSGDAGDYALEREYEDIAAVLEWAGDRVDLVGHSHGAMCALEAALLTDRIGKLVVYEPPLGFVRPPQELVERLRSLLEEGRRDEVVAVFMGEVAGLPPEQVELLRSLPAWQARLDAAGTIPREESANKEYVFDPDRFRQLQVETLYLEGGSSPDAFKQARAAVEAALPNCRVVVMPGQRHAAMDTATDLFNAEVLGFLN